MYMDGRSTRTPVGIPYINAWHGLARLQNYTTIRFGRPPALRFLKIRGDFSHIIKFEPQISKYIFDSPLLMFGIWGFYLEKWRCLG